MADIATGCMFTLGTSTWPAEITTITGNGRSVPVIDVAHLGSTAGEGRPKLFGDLPDEGDVTLNVFYNGDQPAPIKGVAPEQGTITFRVPAGQSSGATKVGQGKITNEGFTLDLETAQVSTVTWTWAGNVVDTPSAA